MPAKSRTKPKRPAAVGRPRKKRAAKSAAPKVQQVAFVSLGCPKNLVDSEKMLGLLAEDGLSLVADETQADAIVINTCGFLEASKDESLGEIDHALELKAQGKVQRVVVAGCLVQRHRAKMLEWRPGIDALIGVFDRDRIVTAVRGSAPTAKQAQGDVAPYSSIAANALLARQARGVQELQHSDLTNASDGNVELRGYFESDRARLRLTPRHYAYLRISEGCNQNCAFCTIPSIRGKMRSKPVPALLAEAAELLADGAFELNLIGQDTTSFGEDIGYAAGLAGMLRELNTLAQQHGGAWLRLMYAYPSCFTDEMIDAIASLPHVLKYIDMPLQHINDRVLDAMRRRTSRKLIETLLQKLRQRVPGITIRTTFISGFPGETKTQHRELVKFVREFGFDAMGVFPYSPEPGTPAGTLYEQGKALDPQVVQERVEELMLTQQEVAFARNEQLAQQRPTVDVLIDGLAQSTGKATTGVGRGGKLYVGRTAQQAPQIDSVTYVQAKQKLVPGELVRCVITAASDYDLVAQPEDENSRNLRLPLLGHH